MNSKSFKFLMAGCVGLFMVGCSNDSVSEDPIIDEAISTSAQEISGQYIVTLNSGAVSKQSMTGKGKASYESAISNMRSEITSEFKSLGVADEQIKSTYNFALQGFSAELTDKQLAELKKDPRVKSIEEDYLITLAPPPHAGPGGGGGGSDPAQETPYGITRVGGAVDGTGKRAWIIDSGIDLDHPDLNVNVALSKTFIDKGKDSKTADDGNGHGTHVAGTVAALDNNIGVVGVAPNAEVVALRVLDSRGSGQFSWTIAALDYVVANGTAGDAVNMSLGPRSRYTDSAVDSAVLSAANAGMKIAIAAGNSSDDASFYSPARTNGTNIYTVSAIDSNDNFASFSNFGSPVDYAAPGVGTKSTYLGGGYATLSGTSMASPHVCGILLLGNIVADGTANNDPDNDPDPIASHN